MKVLGIVLLIFGLVVVANAQKATLVGTVADENGGVIANVSVVATNIEKKTYKTSTNIDGVYRLELPPGNYQIEFVGGRTGFLTTRVNNYKLAPTKMTLYIILDADMQSPTAIYSEFVCDKDWKNCRYVSRQGDGSSKPKEIHIDGFSRKTTKGKQVN